MPSEIMNNKPPVKIRPARSQKDIEDAAGLIKAYAEWLKVDLTFQNFDEEMRTLPGKYAPPKGEILLAFDMTEKAIGCISLRPIVPNKCCEMKRLYVLPEGRGSGVGRMLISSIMEVASHFGYEEMVLDSLPTMAYPLKLYASFGFETVPPYYYNPVEGAVFLGRKLPV